MSTSRLFLDRLPPAKNLARKLDFETQSTIVIFDQRLLRAVPGFKSWVADFPYRFPVRSGESLKSFESFHSVLAKVHKKVGGKAGPKWTVLAVGGGSVGDFAGFFASVYKRGLRLVHIPTTWLAAIDSSHGGKTGLNFEGAKNQIGTFYPSEKTVMVKSILQSLPPAHVRDAIGELLKIAVIDGGAWAKKLRLGKEARETSEIVQTMWRVLPSAVEAKMKIVRRDPNEAKGIRHVLNLGHTFGHVIESLTGKSHGESVWLGFLFALEFSIAEGYLKARESALLNDWLKLQMAAWAISRDRRQLSTSAVRRNLLQDKKRVAGRGQRRATEKVRFVFIRGFGRTVIQPVPVERVLAFGQQNGWLK